MRWPAAFVMAAVCAGGCRGTPPAVVDPWRTRVPPPATGEAAASLDSYYVPPNYPNQGPLPSPTTAPTVAPANSYPQSYPGPGSAPPASSFTPNTSSPTGQGRTSAPTPRQKSPAGGSSTRLVSHSESADQTDSHAGTSSPASDVVQANHLTWTSPAAGSHGSAEPAAESDGSGDVRDIMDLPPVGRSRQTAHRPTGDGSGGHYAYARDYRWLRGQLEYLPAGDEWKLRYIPIDGDTDDYGGSVELVGELPRSFRPGDFVVVQGFPDDEGSRQGAAPIYQMRGIEHQPE